MQFKRHFPASKTRACSRHVILTCPSANHAVTSSCSGLWNARQDSLARAAQIQSNSDHQGASNYSVDIAAPFTNRRERRDWAMDWRNHLHLSRIAKSRLATRSEPSSFPDFNLLHIISESKTVSTIFDNSTPADSPAPPVR